MKRLTGIIVQLVFAGLVLSVTVPAQENRQERAANLRLQLADLEGKETELKSRLAQIEEQMKPENIEASLAGIGSTHPEELRAQRRRQWEIEKKGVQLQLDTLAASRTRLEAAIATTDAMIYQSAGQSPGPNAGPGRAIAPSPAISVPPVRTKSHRTLRRRAKRRVRH